MVRNNPNHLGLFFFPIENYLKELPMTPSQTTELNNLNEQLRLLNLQREPIVKAIKDFERIIYSDEKEIERELNSLFDLSYQGDTEAYYGDLHYGYTLFDVNDEESHEQTIRDIKSNMKELEDILLAINPHLPSPMFGSNFDIYTSGDYCDLIFKFNFVNNLVLIAFETYTNEGK